MEDIDKIKQRFELLKIARELLNEEYINRRAEDHNKWIAENDEAWRTQRRNIPYPPFAQYPTDDELVKAASNLYNFIYQEEIKLMAEVPIENVQQKSIQEGDLVFPEKEPEIEPEPVQKEVIEEPLAKTLLPGWMRRTK